VITHDRSGKECTIFVLLLMSSVVWPGLRSNIISQGKSLVPILSSIILLISDTQLTAHRSNVGVVIIIFHA
jgi:hypothetical protein